jgi:uncharacterized coiled-coil protein SlyX
MKICPECSAEYDDSVNFCAKDGRSLTEKTVAQTRLCPHCANSIPEDAASCPYCKADVDPASPPQWPTRENDRYHGGLSTHERKFSKSAMAALLAGVALSVIGLFLIGNVMLGRNDGSETRQLAEAKIKEVEEKEQKIQALEGQLAQTRQELADSSSQLTALKNRLAENEKELSASHKRLETASREIDRLSSRRAQSSPPPSPRPAVTSQPPPPMPARRAADPGVYEVVRATGVHEDPSAGSRVVSQIRRGTKVTVVRSVGDWLEVRSKHGNPPGFILRDDAMFVGNAN